MSLRADDLEMTGREVCHVGSDFKWMKAEAEAEAETGGGD